MRSSSLLRTLLSLGLATLLAACGRGGTERAIERAIEEETGENAEVDVRTDGSVKVETEDGTFQTGNTLPADWPTDVPVYAGATVQYSASVTETGQPGSAAVLMTTDSAAQVASYYKKALKENGWTVESTIEAQGTTIFSATKDDRVVSFMSASAQGATTITLGVTKQ